MFVSSKFERLLHLPPSPKPNQFYVIESEGTTKLYLSDGHANLALLNETAYTDNDAINAVGNSLVDSSTIQFTYDDTLHTITADVEDHSVSLTKLQNISTNSLIGRYSAGSGIAQILSIGSGLSVFGGVLSASGVVEEITTIASSTTPTPTGGSLWNFFTITALAAGATFATPSGTPVGGNKLLIRIKDDGTARSLAFSAIYRFSSDLASPTTTVISKTMYLNFIYNEADSKWDNISQLGNF